MRSPLYLPFACPYGTGAPTSPLPPCSTPSQAMLEGLQEEPTPLRVVFSQERHHCSLSALLCASLVLITESGSGSDRRALFTSELSSLERSGFSVFRSPCPSAYRGHWQIVRTWFLHLRWLRKASVSGRLLSLGQSYRATHIDLTHSQENCYAKKAKYHSRSHCTP
jgi:hypothetical protein